MQLLLLLNRYSSYAQTFAGQSGILTYIPFEGKADQLTRTYYYDITHNGVKYVGILKITQADLADEWAKFTIKVIKAI